MLIVVYADLLNGSGQDKLTALIAMEIQLAISYFAFKPLFVLLWKATNEVGYSVTSMSDLVEHRDVMASLLAVKHCVSRLHFDMAVSDYALEHRSRIGWIRWMNGRLTDEELLVVLRQLEADGLLESVPSESKDPHDTFKACCSSLVNGRARKRMRRMCCC